MPCDLFLGVPVHRAPAVVAQSGLVVDGWIPVDPLTLETSLPDVYAVGDVTSVGTPKAGVFAEGQASVVADRITFRSGAVPVGTLEGPSRAIAADKVEFGSSRIRRWFDRTWSSDVPAGV
jgi:sulfide:quinone oxidoreductase